MLPAFDGPLTDWNTSWVAVPRFLAGHWYCPSPSQRQCSSLGTLGRCWTLQSYRKNMLNRLGRASPLLNQELDPVGVHFQMLFQSYNNPCRYQNHSLTYNDICIWMLYLFTSRKCAWNHVDMLAVRLHTFGLARSQDAWFGCTALKYLKVVVWLILQERIKSPELATRFYSFLENRHEHAVWELLSVEIHRNLKAGGRYAPGIL